MGLLFVMTFVSMTSIDISTNSLASICSGTWLNKVGDEPISQLYYDSRKSIQPEGAVFFALITPHSNGHLFLGDVVNAGVKTLVISSDANVSELKNVNILKVENTLLAMQQLATFKRKQFKNQVIGITGSNGKTVVKEWLHQLLMPDYNICRSPKSYNSQLGVPLSVWQLELQHNLGIFEAGISEMGEMENLAEIIQPNWGIFTSLGLAHANGFPSKLEKAREKFKLFETCEKVFYPLDQEKINTVAEEFRLKHPDCKLITWSEKHSETDLKVQIQVNGQLTEVVCITQKGTFNLKLPFTDRPSIENAITCTLVLLELNYSFKIISERVQDLTALKMRLELKKAINNCSLINDAYSLDLDSLGYALEFLSRQNQHPKKTLILSDFPEDNTIAEKLYGKLVALLRNFPLQKIIYVGNQMQPFLENLPVKEVHQFDNTSSLIEHFNTLEFSNEAILIKGARKFGFERIAQRLEERIHETLMEIDLDALLHNYRFVKTKLSPKTKTMVMVKALSYGSGSYEISALMAQNGADYLAVAYPDEGVLLRTAGIKLPIMVLNTEVGQFEMCFRYKLEPVIYSFRTLNACIEEFGGNDKPVNIHIEFDTGMRRLGFNVGDVISLGKQLISNPKLQVCSVFSHLASGEDLNDNSYTQQQFSLFEKACEALQKITQKPFLRHILNTAGIFNYPNNAYEMVRLGIGLYGIDSSGKHQAQLLQVGRLKTIISQIRTLQIGDSLGYNRRFTAKEVTKVGTLPIGYADGISRDFGLGKISFLINGKLAPTIGSICMDMCMVNLSGIEAQEGDEVLIFGEENPIYNTAKQSNKIPYEILTGISGRVKRVYIKT